MRIQILFGTESGNSELVAEELAEEIEDRHEVACADLAKFAPSTFDPAVLYFVVCSTHGEGDLPQSSQPFAEAMRRELPDLTGVSYAMFGLGDSTYENYSRGSEHIDAILRDSGGRRVGSYGRHDASGRDDASRLAINWAAEILDEVVATAAA